MERGTVPSCGLCTRVAPQPGGASRHIASRHHQSRQSHCRPPPSSLPLPPAPPPTHLRVEYEHRHVVVERGGIGPGLAVVAVEGLELDVTACTGKGGGGTPGKEGGCALQGVCQWLPHQIVGIHSQTLSIAPTPVGHVISLGHPQLRDGHGTRTLHRQTQEVQRAPRMQLPDCGPHLSGCDGDTP